MRWKSKLIDAGFRLLGTTRLHRIAAPFTAGRGVILTFHHIRADRADGFDPNKMLSITPDFLDATIRLLRSNGYAIVTMDEALQRLAADDRRQRFAVLTFDDGFRDNLTQGLPVLEQHGAPAIFYITTGFAERTARLWWVELEEAVRRASSIDVDLGDERIVLDTATPAAKTSAFWRVYWALRRGPEERLLGVIGELAKQHGICSAALCEALCLDWPAVEAMADHPLVTIGAHTLTHPMLAKHDDARVRAELAGGKATLEARLGRPVRHLAFPVGDPTSAGPREFELAQEAGYASAVTTRPGLLFAPHRGRPFCLPRVSVNGLHQTTRDLDILLSGLALLLWNKGRRVIPA